MVLRLVVEAEQALAGDVRWFSEGDGNGIGRAVGLGNLGSSLRSDINCSDGLCWSICFSESLFLTCKTSGLG